MTRRSFCLALYTDEYNARQESNVLPVNLKEQGKCRQS